MKRVFLIAAIALGSVASMAQVSAYKQGSGEIVDGYTLPRTVINVKVAQEREVILRGPYARYASQYLGVTGAPMSDKESYRILGATLSWGVEPDIEATFALDSKSKERVKSFQWLTANEHMQSDLPQDNNYKGAKLGGENPFKDVGTSTVQQSSGNDLSFELMSGIEKSTEQMAADAAAVIFKIRKRRIELITGEQGENVFGAGLQAALDEMQRIEDEYVSLFLGKRYVQRTEHVFEVVPQAGEQRVVAFRFTSDGGVVPTTDLMASPISLELTPIDSAVSVGDKSKSSGVLYRVPLMEQITLSDGSTVYATKKIPVYQNGIFTQIPVL